MVAEGQVGRQLVTLGQHTDSGLDAFPVKPETLQVKHQPHEERRGISLGMLIEVDDVAPIAEHEVREGGHQAGAVLATDEKGRVNHGETGS